VAAGVKAQCSPSNKLLQEVTICLFLQLPIQIHLDFSPPPAKSPDLWSRLSERRFVMDCLISLALLACSAEGPEPLQVSDIQVCQGRLGPVREPVYDLGDEFFIRFKILGVKANSDSYVSIDCCMDILDPDGKKIEHKAATVPISHYFSQETNVGFQFPILPTWKKGKYVVKGIVKDNASEKQTQFEQEFTVRPARLAILPFQFFMDPERRIPAPNGGLVNQGLQYQSWIVGLEKNKTLVDCELTIQILDSEGKKLLKEFDVGRSKASDPDERAIGYAAPILGWLPLECAGDFILRAIAKDHVTGATVSMDTPFHITAPPATDNAAAKNR
jgi:hypothetical protein